MCVRRALYQLPIGVQIRIRDAKRSILRQFDWAAQVRQLRLRERPYSGETSAGNRSAALSRRIAIYSLHHSSSIEYGLATALRLRGHDVRGVLCDGILPLCEMNLGPIPRPPCQVCIEFSSRYEDAFGMRYDRLTDFLSDADRLDAEKLVAGTPDEALPMLEVSGIPIGRFARREIQRYYRGYIFDPVHDPAYRKWLISAVLLIWLSERWLDAVRPDLAAVCSGRTLPTACFYEVARRRRIRVVTWDGTASHRDGLMLSHNEPATEIPLKEAWCEAASRELAKDELEKLTSYLNNWSRSRNTPFPYNTNPLEDQEVVRQRLGLRPNARLVVGFTNTSWDIAVIDRDVGFDNMFDWIFGLVQYAVHRPDVDFVIRAHPAEVKVPRDLRSRSPVGKELRSRFQPLPNNLRVVEGGDPISSYTLADMAHVNIVYSTRLGLELALRGKRPWIAGDVTYRDKGFTLDLTSKDHMFSLLECDAFDNRLSDEEIELARRFAYLWFFRYEVRLPLLHPADKRFTLRSFEQLAPGGHPVLDRLCDAFVTGKPFVDIVVPN
jgi:hypothetical protein